LHSCIIMSSLEKADYECPVILDTSEREGEQ